MIALRLATPDDVRAIASFGERVFRETFGPDNRPDDMDAYCGAAYALDLQRRELADPRRLTIVIEADHALAGYAQLQESSAPQCVTGPGLIELVRFYVDRRWHGSGIAGTLMRETIARARARGARTLWLGVWERNARAIAFYRKHGFADVGAQPFRLGSDLQSDRVMTRALAP